MVITIRDFLCYNTFMEKWFVASKKADFNEISEKYDISPILARIIRNRDVISDDEIASFIGGKRENLFDPFLLYGMEKAVGILSDSISNCDRIRVIGDYDVDGICASHVLYAALSGFGAIVDVAIPHRVKDGYGLNENLIKDACEDGIDLIITCDNGISAVEPIALAKEYGMKVIVTDHHEVPYVEKESGREEILPPADCIIDPKQKSCSYPQEGICGAVVAMKVMQALNRKLNLPRSEDDLLDELLPFAALASVCDVMELLGENRIIVKEGLRLMRTSPCRGIDALIRANSMEAKNLNAYHLGFVIGPSLNATGRLDSAMRAFDLLKAKSVDEAAVIAGELKSLNDSRKAMTVDGVNKAVRIINESGYDNDKVLVVYLPDCHESLAGIIAGRLREMYCKPTFVLTDAEDGLKGSGRSIDEYNMYEALTEVKELFTKYGGHKLAAGLSLPMGTDGLMRDKLNERCQLTEDDFVKKIHIDMILPLSYADERLARELEKLEPFGVGNSKPLFAQRDVKFIACRRMGSAGKYGKYTVLDEQGKAREAVYFGDADEFDAFLNEKGKVANITYQLGINSFRGITSAQIIIQNYC